MNWCSQKRSIDFASPAPVHSTKSAKNSTLQYEGEQLEPFPVRFCFLTRSTGNNEYIFDILASSYRIVIHGIRVGETFHQWIPRTLFLTFILWHNFH